jgi:hypothetical protein
MERATNAPLLPCLAGIRYVCCVKGSRAIRRSAMRGLISVLFASIVLAPISAGSNPFAFFQPTVVLSPVDRESLESGTPIVRFLQATGHEVGAFTAIALPPAVTADRAAAWMRRVELLRENPYVIASQRLSTPPRLEDFERLVLDDDDIEEIRRCVPGRCGVKLSAADLTSLTAIARSGGTHWKPRLQQAFREMLLRRALTFTAGGLAALDDLVDKKHPSSPAGAFAPLVAHTAFLGDRTPELARRLLHCGAVPPAGGESFMYWSKERLGGRPVIAVTHILLMPPAGASSPLLMVGAQVYASHYLDASLTVTAFLRDQPTSRPYFVYLHRSSVDLLSGFWGGLARSIIESRARKDGPVILNGIAERLAGGQPPSGSARHAWPFHSRAPQD